jgi:hypothetical protein
MRIEGKGNVEPCPVRVSISKADLALLSSEADRRNRHRGYASGGTAWKRGLTRNPILMGMVGELATERFLCEQGIRCTVLDFSLNDGDGGKDAEIANVVYQVKTGSGMFATCLVRRISDRHDLQELVADRFIFCCWSYGDAVCILRGWCTREVLRADSKRMKARKGNHHNLEIPATSLSRMQDLASLIKQEVQGVK